MKHVPFSSVGQQLQARRTEILGEVLKDQRVAKSSGAFYRTPAGVSRMAR